MIDWMKKTWCIYIIEYYAAIKTEIIFVARTWMELEAITLSKITQEQITTYHMFLHLSGN